MRILIGTILIWLTGSMITSAQNIVVPNKINKSIHQQKIGKITFLSQTKAIEEISDHDFIQTFELGDKKSLDLRVFLENSLTNYLHQLDQSLTVDQLIKNGNFQFSFYVDNKPIYTENLNTGAGTAESKNQYTTFRIPLISTNNEDSWGRFLWNRFYFGNNGEDALFGGKHLLKIEIRPYLKSTSGIILGKIIAAGEINFITPIVELKKEDIAVQKIMSGSDWELAKDTLNTKLIEQLNAKIKEKRFKDITSVAIIKDGKLLLEEYFNGSNRHTLHDTRSVGKSFASTLTGMAIRDGYIINENQALKQFYDLKKYGNYSTLKDSITLQHLLTMSAVFEGSDSDPNSPGNEENMYPTDNWVKFTLDLPVYTDRKNGKQWNYFTAGVVLIGDILHQKVPEGLETYADKNLFSLLKIKDYKWQYTPQKVANTAGGLRLRTLDLAKYGQLYLNNGKWNGKELLPSSWIAKTFTNYFPQEENISGYGYLFWKEVFEIDGNKYEAYACSGNGGNKVYVFRNLPLVIVITATAYNQAYAHPQVSKIVREYLLPAVLKP